VGELYELGCADTVSADPGTGPTTVSSTGALVAYSGKRTGYLLFNLLMFIQDDLPRTREWSRMPILRRISGGEMSTSP
jgi:hypothetical protein